MEISQLKDWRGLDVHAPVVKVGRRAGLREIIGDDHIYPTVDAAVNEIIQ